MQFRLPVHGVRAALVLAIVPALAYAAQGNMMSITSTTQMKGAGMPDMPARTMTIQRCVAPNKMSDPKTWSTHKDCTVSDVHQSASGVSAHLVCKQMTADMHMQVGAGGAVHGTVHITGNERGSSMEIVSTFDAKRTGSCSLPAEAD